MEAKRRLCKIFGLITMIFIFLTLSASCNKHDIAFKKNSEYRYFFGVGFTDNNQFILVKDEKLPVIFDTTKSNVDALNSLKSLKWNVLYPNSGGNITIYGSYNQKNNLFILNHWYLPPFFKRKEVFDIGDVPHKYSEETKEYLDANDFENVIRKNPKIYNSKSFSEL